MSKLNSTTMAVFHTPVAALNSGFYQSAKIGLLDDDYADLKRGQADQGVIQTLIDNGMTEERAIAVQAKWS
jgi:hypothetical protein